MHRGFTTLVSIAVVLAGITSLPSPLDAADAEVDLKEITRRLKAWRSSFVNLRVVWELRALPATKQPLLEWSPPATAKDARLFLRGQWIWADDGMDLLESRTFFPRGGGGRDIDVFNGRKGIVFRALYRRPKQGSEEFLQLTIRGLGVGKPISRSDRAPVRALYWPGVAAWLPEIVSKWKCEGIDEINGARCARIVGSPSATSDLTSLETLWLDLEHDCLVRRYRSPGVVSPKSDYLVDEFQRLPNGLWFPKRGRLQLQVGEYENQLWVVTEVQVNGRLDLQRFEPPRPDKGTVVDKRGVVYTHGVSSARSNRDGQEGADGNNKPPTLATPPTSGWMWWLGGLLVTSFLFLVAGFWFWRKT